MTLCSASIFGVRGFVHARKRVAGGGPGQAILAAEPPATGLLHNDFTEGTGGKELPTLPWISGWVGQAPATQRPCYGTPEGGSVHQTLLTRKQCVKVIYTGKTSVSRTVVLNIIQTHFGVQAVPETTFPAFNRMD